MNEEDELDLTRQVADEFKRTIRIKNLFIIIMMLIAFLFFLQAVFQKQEDNLICENRLIYNNSCGQLIWNPERGEFIYPSGYNSSEDTLINISKININK